MKTNDIQQAISGFSTVAVIGGPLIVRVHKALDVVYSDSNKHGYFISVDFKFRQNDAMYIGTPGWDGLSKSEATREANALARQIYIRHSVMESAKNNAVSCDTANNRITAKVQEENFNKLVSKYNSEFIDR